MYSYEFLIEKLKKIIGGGGESVNIFSNGIYFIFSYF